MPDVFQVSGDEIRFGPWTVATLDPRMPATVRERVLEALDCLDYEPQMAELRREHEKEMEESDAAHAEEIARLEKDHEAAVFDYEKVVEDLQAELDAA